MWTKLKEKKSSEGDATENTKHLSTRLEILIKSVLRHAAKGKFSGEQWRQYSVCLRTIGLIVAPWKFDVLKSSIFALEASLLGQIFVLRTSNVRGATISR